MIKDIDDILGDRVNTNDLIERLEELETEKGDIESDIENAEADIDTHQTTIDEETDDQGFLSDAGIAASSELSSAHLDHEKSKRELEEWQEENGEELSRLINIKANFGGEIPQNTDLIAESDFTAYAMEYAEETEAVQRHNSWPINHINWSDAAEELKHDYTTVEIESTTYYYKE